MSIGENPQYGYEPERRPETSLKEIGRATVDILRAVELGDITPAQALDMMTAMEPGAAPSPED